MLAGQVDLFIAATGRIFIAMSRDRSPDRLAVARVAWATRPPWPLACIDSGFISENIYLFCASEGLATGYRGHYDEKALAPKLNLRPDQTLIAAQSVGYPKP